MEHKYDFLGVEQNYIDKTGALEKGIVVFPSLYIQGAAACGKSTAVKMMLGRRPQQKVKQFYVEVELRQAETFLEKLSLIREEMKRESWWLVLEECPASLPKDVESLIYEMIREISNDSKVILVGREQLPETFLTLLWNGKMERIPQEKFVFTRQEVRRLVEDRRSSLNSVDLYEVTGGWPGCVMLMLRMAEQSNKQISVQALRDSYEVDTYIQQQIIQTVSIDEMQVLQLARICPWINGALCEDVCGIHEAGKLLEKLQRKGILTFNERKRTWRLAPLFVNEHRGAEEEYPVEFWETLVNWYAHHAYFEEMFICLKQSEEVQIWQSVLLEYFSEVPFLEELFPAVAEVLDLTEWTDMIPELCYLRGMYCLYCDNMPGYDREIQNLEKGMQLRKNAQEEIYAKYAEIYLNLRFVDERIGVDEWLELVDNYWNEEKGCEKLSLYGRKNQSVSCLSGMRELSDLFACPRREENRKARLWKEYLGENEWLMYQIARLEYYLETDQRERITEETRNFLRNTLSQTEDYWLPIYFLLAHLQYRKECDEELIMHIKSLEEQLVSEDSSCRKNAESVMEVKGLLLGERGELLHWSQERERAIKTVITEENVVYYYCHTIGYIYQEQYEKAQKILHKLILYFKKKRNVRFLAEVLFEQAIVLHELGQSGKALQSVIESFLINGNRHYVGFYTEYGQSGREVLELYVDWLKKSSPEGWRRKKQYKYGNVVRMPQNDYIDYLLRKAKHRRIHSGEAVQHCGAESLTMMERIVLQCISLGMTNAEICEELNLKLPTVKSHIYNLYKKLGVKNRTQAILFGEEMKKLKNET